MVNDNEQGARQPALPPLEAPSLREQWESAGAVGLLEQIDVGICTLRVVTEHVAQFGHKVGSKVLRMVYESRQ